MSEVALIVLAFIAGTMFGAVVGVVTYAIAKAAKDPQFVRAENERNRRMW